MAKLEIWTAAGHANPSFEDLKFCFEGPALAPGAVAVRMLSEGQKWTLPFFRTFQLEVWNGSGPSNTQF